MPNRFIQQLTAAFVLMLFVTHCEMNADDVPSLKDLEPQIDKALAAYNAQDFKAFYADYAKIVEAACTELAFKGLYVDGAMKTFGTYESKKLDKDATVLIARAPLVVYEGTFKKGRARISANFFQEDGKYRFTQIRIDPLK